MTPEKAKERCDRFWDEDLQFHTEASAFDIPWSVPYDFSAMVEEIKWEEYGQTEMFWANEDSN